MDGVITIIVGVVLGFHLCVLAKKSILHIGRPFSKTDWWLVNIVGTLATLGVLLVEWFCYWILLILFEDTHPILFFVRKGVFVPFFSLAISAPFGWIVRKRFLDCSDGYSSRLGGLCLAAIIGAICINAQWFLLPTLGNGVFKEYVQDSVIAWSVLALGTAVPLDVFCKSRTEIKEKKKLRFQDYAFPMLTILVISCFHFFGTWFGLDYLIFPFIVAVVFSGLTFILFYEILDFPSIKRFERQLRKCGEQGFTSREYTGSYHTIRFHIDGEYLEILESKNVIYYGDNGEEFDKWFSYQKQKLGKKMIDVRHILANRRKQQLAFLKSEAKIIADDPEKYSSEKKKEPKRKTDN